MDISPDKQNIDRVFSNTAYYIEFYQRDYRWTDAPVLRPLDDIFHKFKEQYARSSEMNPGKETISAHYMVKHYETIGLCLGKELKDKHCFETFVFYFLHRLVLINLAVEQTDVSMVFEVINDRGVRLRPYEILKGKLLGQINKIELDKENYNGLWEKKAEAINAFKEDELDSFFRFYLKAKFAATRNDGQRFDGDYHRAMFARDM